MLTLRFSDSVYGGPLRANVRYDLSVADSNGLPILEKDNLVAVNATDSQEMTFHKDGTYRVSVSVKDLDRPNQIGDFTRNGVATGIVVVPEFSFISLIAVVGLEGAIILSRKTFVSRKNS